MPSPMPVDPDPGPQGVEHFLLVETATGGQLGDLIEQPFLLVTDVVIGAVFAEQFTYSHRVNDRVYGPPSSLCV